MLKSEAKPKAKASSKASAVVIKLHQEGEKLVTQNKLQQAIRTFREVLKQDANYFPSQKALGEVLSRLGKAAFEERDYELAESYLEEAHILVPEEEESHQVLAQLRYQQYQREYGKVSRPYAKPEGSQRVENLIFQGGGVKGLAYLGALGKLYTTHIDEDAIKRVGGTSAGAITAVMIGLGYSLGEIEGRIKALDFTEFMDGDFRETLLDFIHRREDIMQLGKGIFADAKKVKNASQNPFAASSGASHLSKAKSHPDVRTIFRAAKLLGEQELGFFPGDFFRDQWLEKLIQTKTGIAYLTFAELEELKRKDPEQFGALKEMYFVGSNINTGKAEVFSYETTPTAIISDAIRISMSLPLIYKPHQLHHKIEGKRVPDASGHLYVDGGMLDNYPLWIFDEKQYVDGVKGDRRKCHNPYTLGLRLVDEKEYGHYVSGLALPASENPQGLGQYLWQLMQAIYKKQESDHQKNLEQSRTVYIDYLGVNAAEFDLDNKTQDALIASGEAAVTAYFAKGISNLWTLVREGDTQAVLQGLLAGENPNCVSPQGETLLDIALSLNNKALLVALVSCGATECKDNRAMIAVLREALASPFVDRTLLQNRLALFEGKNDTRRPEALPEKGEEHASVGRSYGR